MTDAQYAAQSTPSDGAIAYAHRRSYRMTDGPTTWKDHAAECGPCGRDLEVARTRKSRK